jgi:hypothetical protein
MLQNVQRQTGNRAAFAGNANQHYHQYLQPLMMGASFRNSGALMHSMAHFGAAHHQQMAASHAVNHGVNHVAHAARRR